MNKIEQNGPIPYDRMFMQIKSPFDEAAREQQRKMIYEYPLRVARGFEKGVLEAGKKVKISEGSTETKATSILHEIPKIEPAVVESPAIANVFFQGFTNMEPKDPGRLSAALAFCPLYLPGALPESRLDRNPTGVESILASRVGKKWEATLHVVDTLKAHAEKMGSQLEITATFGDMGVIVADPMYASDPLMRIHSEVYQEAFDKYCSEIGVRMNFQNLSDVQEPRNPNHRVGKFIVVDPSETASVTPPVEELIVLLGVDIPLATGRQRKKAEVITQAFENCGRNLRLFRELVHTYLSYLPGIATGLDMRVGMERAQWLLAIPYVDRYSSLNKTPTADVLVS